MKAQVKSLNEIDIKHQITQNLKKVRNSQNPKKPKLTDSHPKMKLVDGVYILEHDNELPLD